MAAREAAGEEAVAKKTVGAAMRLRNGSTVTDEGCGKLFSTLLLLYYS